MSNKYILGLAFLSVIAVPTVAAAGDVLGISQNGSTTIVRCSVGADFKITQDSYGKCHTAGEIGGVGCSYAIDRAKWACTVR